MEINSSGTIENHFIKIMKLKFHGILYNFKTQCIVDTNGSIK